MADDQTTGRNLELHSRAAPNMEAHCPVNGLDTGRKVVSTVVSGILFAGFSTVDGINMGYSFLL